MSICHLGHPCHLGHSDHVYHNDHGHDDPDHSDHTANTYNVSTKGYSNLLLVRHSYPYILWTTPPQSWSPWTLCHFPGVLHPTGWHQEETRETCSIKINTLMFLRTRHLLSLKCNIYHPLPESSSYHHMAVTCSYNTSIVGECASSTQLLAITWLAYQ